MKDGGPALPGGYAGIDEAGEDVYVGMSLRDYFAAKAMQAILTNRAVEQYRQQLDELGVSNYQQDVAVAHVAYKQADSMLKAREVNQ
jgi:hypothetical protein